MGLEEELHGRAYEQIPLKVTSGVLLHIGAGIYSSVAGAIKELVSNSFDADATRVIISTDYPRFEEIRAVDNGEGMLPSYFTKAMQSIGSSLKGIVRPGGLTPVYQRPIIGHLGIGLMALTQVCSEATIESQIRGSDTKFVAKLDFAEFKERRERQLQTAKLDIFRGLAERQGGIEAMQQKLASLDRQDDEYIETLAQLELAREAESVFTDEQMEDPEGEHLGYCVIYSDLPAVPGGHGTRITLSRIDNGVRSSLLDRNRPEDGIPEHHRDRGWDRFRAEVDNWSWGDLCTRLRMRTSQLAYQSLPGYHQFLWELSAMTPVQYLDEGPVVLKPDLLVQKRRELESFKFAVFVDNRPISKPILLPAGNLAREETLESGYDYYVETFSRDEEVDGDPLKYEGYLFWQRKQVEPSALRGVQIYIRNVGIGLYDRTLLGFSTVNPTSRAGQISGEIYVDAGLERALNVDRNSFRETDAHYLALREHLWHILGSAKRGNGVMGMSVDAYWKRRARRDEEALEVHTKRLAARLEEASKGEFVLEFSDSANPQPYVVEANRITVYNGSPSWPRSRSDRYLSQHVLVPVRAAIAAGASVEQVLALLEDILLKH